MMQQQQPLQTCPNCGKPLPGTTAVCPNCGAALTAIPPIPMLGMNPVPSEPEVLWTRSRKGDITVGIILGLVSPMVIPLLITGVYYLTPNSIIGSIVSLVGGLGQLVGPFLAAYFLKKKYPVAGDAMMKTLLFLIAAGVLILLGVLAICLFGIGRP